MKPKVGTSLLILILLMHSLYSFGQSNLNADAGIVITNYHLERHYNYRMVGWTIGGMTEFKIKRHFSLNTGLLYSKERFLDWSEVEDIKLHLHNFNLPIQFTYHLGKRFSLSLGPKFSYLISARIKNGIGERHNVTAEYKRFDESLLCGAWYRIGEKIKLKLEYDYGLKTIGFRPFLGPLINRHVELRVSYQIKSKNR
jgi:hypothetical protein